MKILTADDSRLVRNSFKRYLNELGYNDVTVLEAADGLQALSLFNNNPDVLILDLIMPDPDGTEVLKILKQKEHSCYIAVLSSNFQQPVKDRVIELGADLFIEKPLSKAKVDMIINEYKKAKNI
ncbi:MAG: response regulator [Desulfobacterales bacterium]|nr:response regulator [Desulfobacterales bacterium]